MKFKLGELVQLSAAGKTRMHNSNYNAEGAYGLVVHIHHDTAFPIKCVWYGSRNQPAQWDSWAPFKSYELKRKRA